MASQARRLRRLAKQGKLPIESIKEVKSNKTRHIPNEVKPYRVIYK